MTKKSVEEVLQELGFELPQVPAPAGEYIPAKAIGDLVYVSGQGPIRNGEPVYVGRVGAEVSLEDGYKAAQLSVLNCLAALKDVIGSLDAVEEIVQVRGFVSSAPNFYDQPAVINGASELLVKLFGERGRHARAAIGTSVLPRNIPVEVELVVKIRHTPKAKGVVKCGEDWEKA
ncbi:MAG: RidA family protein [Candidatus Hadarchaeum sp.]|uniref:RidA family protein n=1 Tax=Candidatus Hadarchaeum sp. TaxID=2883567 RepID=UPI00317FA2A8